MDINGSLEKMKYDTRLIEWNIRTGKVKKADHESFLNGLPDEADAAEALNLDDDMATEAVESTETTEEAPNSSYI